MAFFLHSDPLSNQSSQAEAVEQVHLTTQAIRRRYGMDRFQLGLMLHTIQEAKLWIGKAESFSHYLQDLRINSNAARQYMAVAKTFMIDFALSEQILESLAMCNMTVLFEASKVVTQDNLTDIIDSLVVLHQRDALQGLKEMAPDYDVTRDPPHVNRMVDQFYGLSDDMRIAFLHRIQRTQKAQGASSLN